MAHRGLRRIAERRWACAARTPCTPYTPHAGLHGSAPASHQARQGRPTRTSQALEKHVVAGSFLFRFSDRDPGPDPDHGSGRAAAEVALFRRSPKEPAADPQRQHAYAGRLGPIAGSISAEDGGCALATARRELAEETGLGAASVELMRRGRPYPMVDAELGREWSIHPFAFRLRSVAEGGLGEAGIRLDWEHVGWEWYDPLRVADGPDLPAVPGLVESLRRVWPEYDLGVAAGPGLARAFEECEAGMCWRDGGLRAVSILRDIISRLDPEELGSGAVRRGIRLVAGHLWWQMGKTAKADMDRAALLLLLDEFERIVGAGGTAKEKLELVQKSLDSIATRLVVEGKWCEDDSSRVLVLQHVGPHRFFGGTD